MSDHRIGVLFLAGLALGGSRPALCETPPSEPLTLRRAAQLALDHAPEVAAARAEADEAGASARLAAVGFKPQAAVTTTPGYSTGLPVQVAGQVPSIIGFELRKTLYDPWRRARALEVDSAAAAARGSFERTSAATARAAAISYGRVWAGQVRDADARRRVEAREAILRRVSTLRREGRRTDLDVERAGLQVARAKQKLLDHQTELDLDRLELARLIDWPAGEKFALPEDGLAGLPEPPAGDDLAAARAADPELRAHAERIDALEHSVSLAVRSWQPVIEAEAQYLRLASYNNFDQYFVKFKQDNFTVGVSVVLPVWTGGRFDEERAAARARLARAEGERRVRERDLELAVRRAEAESTRASAEAALSRRAVDVAREELRVTRALADEGRGDPDAVENAEIALANAEDDQADAGQRLLAARINLLDLRGELSAALLGAPAGERNPNAVKAESGRMLEAGQTSH
jgi:outer membrane protein